MTPPARTVVRTMAFVTCALLLAAACAQGGDTKAVRAEELAGQPPGGVKKGSLNGVTMTFTSYGGGFQDGQETAFAKPFAKSTGAKVLTDEPTDTAKIQAQVNSDNVLWDVVDSGADDVAAGCGRLFEPLDYSIIDRRIQLAETHSEAQVLRPLPELCLRLVLRRGQIQGQPSRQLG